MAADPNAYKMQGPDTVGNPMPTQSQPPGSAGSGQSAIRGAQQGGAQQNVATLTGAVGQTTYISGCVIIAGGATAGLAVNATITGILGGQLNIPMHAQVGADALPHTIVLNFNPPLPSSGLNTNILVTLPTLGAGNTTAGVSAWGFTQ